MSIELDWEALTSGPDGDALAEQIRSFIHDKFQTVPLPRFIKSVTVHGFDFGKIPPELELKDITDPLPDFYEQDIEEDESDDDFEESEHALEKERPTAGESTGKPPNRLRVALKHEMAGHDLGSPYLGTSTPGILGGPGLNYLYGHLGNGSHTPLAAVAGAHLGNSWLGSAFDQAQHTASHSRNPSQSSVSDDNYQSNLPMMRGLREKSSVSTLAPTSVGTSRPPTRDTQLADDYAVEDNEENNAGDHMTVPGDNESQSHPRREPRVDDVQAVFRIQYAGDVRLNLTAEILLDYPMPSFVGIPLKLNITGLSFDGVGVLAHIRKRLHFCFLSPEDALTAIGSEQGIEAEKSQDANTARPRNKFGGLLQEIKVDSEIGQRESGKQSLKNVGKVEKFVLEQVRRIFDEEFVYPSFWTFLV